jgi:hypothetical protein
MEVVQGICLVQIPEQQKKKKKLCKEITNIGNWKQRELLFLFLFQVF